MNKTEQAEQLRLAAEIIETGHPFEVQFPNSSKWGRSPHISPDVQVVNNCKIRLTLATPPDGRPLHNPDNLTAEQVGAGWRLFLPEEVDCRHGGKCELWCDDEWLSEEIEGGEHGITYRVPLSVPWPEAPKPEPTTKTVPLGPEDVLPGSVVLGIESSWLCITCCHADGLYVQNSEDNLNLLTWHELLQDGVKINRSIPLTGKWDANAWEPCSKEVSP